ncbi:NAD(P)-dependent oxidoreductase [Arsenicicoccus bolidensis]|uniref:NAD(P)-dependent oxidoreductase n=1 Tax=Arsenicicoccus bolidensis TaxID=229480 RepID=UPI0004299FCE|nr:NAD(P)H-binding protein [Arsenicicoccus bolidensis]
MRIAVFGATGMAGSAIVDEASSRAHDVVAVARRAPSGALRSHAVLPLDVADNSALIPVLHGVDAAVLAIRFPPGDEHRLAPATARFLDAASRAATSVLVVGGSAPLWSPRAAHTRVIDDPAYVPPEWRDVAQASLDQLESCRQHPYDGWAYLSPPAVFERGDRSGVYQRGTATLLQDAHGRSRITAPDLAIAVLDELENPRGEKHFTVASA